MADLVEIINTALERSHLSAAEASRLAVGNTALIRNMRKAKREGKETREHYHAISRLADVLGLELYFGPPRDGQAFLESPAPYELGEAHAMHVVELLEGSPPMADAPAPLAIPSAWFARLGLDISQVALVNAPDASMAPELPAGAVALVDTSDRGVTHRDHVHAVSVGGVIKLRHVAMTDESLTLLPCNSDFAIDTLFRASIPTLPVLGRVRAVFLPNP